MATVVKGCYVCHSTENLFSCTTCNCVEYCSTSHKTLDEPRHSPECEIVKDLLQKSLDAEKPLREHYPDPDNTVGVTPVDLLEDPPSSISFMESGREYLKSRVALLREYLKFGTSKALENAEAEVLHLHWVCRYGGGSRTLTTALMLRGNGHQRCYSYVAWWNDHFCACCWGEKARPGNVLIHPEKYVRDPFEPVDNLAPLGGLPDTEYSIPIAFLKILWVEELKDLERFKSVEGWFRTKLNYDVTEVIRGQMVDSDVLKERSELWRKDNTELIEKLKDQVRVLVEDVESRSMFFWERLLEAVEGRLGEPDPDDEESGGRRGDTRYLVEVYADVWKGRERPLKVIKGKLVKEIPEARKKMEPYRRPRLFGDKEDIIPLDKFTFSDESAEELTS
ncbi:hypothetical protein ABW19_dt0201571 [Dactylella cylindrospora]|nr:hypothetical protein ABW19_dt0201571 [Dactylella cylindrospora]